MRRLTLKEVPVVKQAILEKRQNFKCVLCGIRLTVLTGCLDHDHTTGVCRGVLCRNCNGIEGKIRNLVTRARRGTDHPIYLKALVDYWTVHSRDQTGMIYPTHLDEAQLIVKRKTRAKKLAIKRKAAKNA